MIDAHDSVTLPLSTRLRQGIEGEQQLPTIYQALLSLPTCKGPVIGKLGTYAAVSIAHEEYFTDIRPYRKYGRHPVRLKGIGGHDNLVLTSVGNLVIEEPNSGKISILCYVYNRPISSYKTVCIIGMRNLWIRRINLQYHMGRALEGNVLPLHFSNKAKETLPQHRHRSLLLATMTTGI